MPPTVRRLLTRLRRRERLQAVSWSAARGLALAFLLLVAACLLDWLIDLRRDTPPSLRAALLAVQLAAWLAIALLTLRHLFGRIGDDRLALLAEERVPALNHRLISAVQLNRPGARTAGMSPALIEAVTREAGRLAGDVAPSEVIGGERLRRALFVLVPLGLLAAGLYEFDRATCSALLARVLLADRPIPRSVELAAGDALWAAGEEGRLEVVALGTVSPDDAGEVLLEPDSGPPFRLALEYDRPSRQGAVFVARVPPGDEPFSFRAWLKDGRLRTPGAVRYAPRPVVQSLASWVELPPEKLGRKPDGSPYDEPQRGGDVRYRVEGSRVRLAVAAQVPLREARVRVEGKSPRQVVVRPAPPGPACVVRFNLLPGDTGYAVSLTAESGFSGAEEARRSIRRLPLEPPTVAFLPERLGGTGPPTEEDEVEGIPVVLGERCRLEYAGSDRYGLSHARLRYRVVRRPKDGEDSGAAEDLDSFRILPLGAGPNPRPPVSGRALEEFSTRPADHPAALPDSAGGGRFDFSTRGIPDGRGGLMKLVPGDRIQFYVEAFGKADPTGRPGRSAVREKELVLAPALWAWLERKNELVRRTQQLEEQQRAARPGESD